MKKIFLAVLIFLLASALQAEDFSLYLEGGGSLGLILTGGAGDTAGVEWLNSGDFDDLLGYIHGNIIQPDVDLLVAGLYSNSGAKTRGFLVRYAFSSSYCRDFLYTNSAGNDIPFVTLDSVNDGHFIGIGARQYFTQNIYIQGDAGMNFITGSSRISISPYKAGVDEISEVAEFGGPVFAAHLEADYEWPGGAGHSLKLGVGCGVDMGSLDYNRIRRNITQSSIEYISDVTDYFQLNLFIKAGVVLDISSVIPWIKPTATPEVTPPMPEVTEIPTPVPSATAVPAATATPAPKKAAKPKPAATKPTPKPTPKPAGKKK